MTLQENIERLTKLAEESANPGQKVTIEGKIYIEAKKLLRVYYFNKGDTKTSMEVLDWSPTQVIKKAYALSLIGGHHDL